MMRRKGAIEDLALFVGIGGVVEIWNPANRARERTTAISRRSPPTGSRKKGLVGMSPDAAAPHVPVLLDEVIAALAIVPGEIHVDGTFGAGGYTKAILDKGAARSSLSIAIPRRSSMARPWPLRAGGA